MSAYQYLRNRFYIQDNQKPVLDEDDNKVYYDFRWILLNHTKEFSLDSDPDLIKGQQYLGFIHELSHLYQDLSLCSCISEHIYKSRVFRSYVDETFVDCPSPFSLTEEEELIYNQIYRTSVSVTEDNIYRASIGEERLKFGSKSNSIFSSITYRDLLESYAEMKAWQSIICETKDDESNYKYIYELLVSRNQNLRVGESGYRDFSLKYKENSLDRYTIVRSVFLLFLYYCKRNSLFIYDMVKSNFPIQAVSIFYLLSMGGIEEKMFSDRDYLLHMEGAILKWILFCLDIALTIPHVTQINNYIKKGLSVIEDFNPCTRFYKVLLIIHRYPEVFNQVNPQDKWVELFDFIAAKLHWPSYYQTVHSINKLNKIYHCGNFTIYQEHLLASRLYSDMESTNGAILRMFKSSNIPIIIHFPNLFLLTRYTETNMVEMFVSDFKLLEYDSQDPVIFEKFTDDDDIILQELFINDINMQIYNNITNKRNVFRCMFPFFKCFDNCSIDNFANLCNEKRECAAQFHISKQQKYFYDRLERNNVFRYE